MTVATVGLDMIAWNPFRTTGVVLTIFAFAALPADPAAVFRIARCESSSDSALKPAVASDLIVLVFVVLPSLLRELETIPTSLAKALAAFWTLDATLEEVEVEVELELELVAKVLVSGTSLARIG